MISLNKPHKGRKKKFCRITYKHIAELTGLNIGTIMNKASKGHFDFKNPESVIKFILGSILLKEASSLK